ncbi:MAG TPA: hypothetical protein VNU01_03770 [Egibacteraceae bacterium]|nr:hypothetical protein [Egibacteraceae bacterium]
MEEELRDRWLRLLAPLGVSEAQAAPVLDDLWRRYGEPGRAYHTIAHVRHVLEVVDFLRGREPVDDPIAIELAVWFHDAVYEPGGQRNEERSAALAAETLLGWGLAAERVAHVVDLVHVTAAHLPGDADGRVLADADLAVLASPPDAYELYRRGVRVEYAHLDDGAWRAGRAAFLRGMLAREAIFSTPTFRGQAERVARANLSAELERLDSG